MNIIHIIFAVKKKFNRRQKKRDRHSFESALSLFIILRRRIKRLLRTVKKEVCLLSSISLFYETFPLVLQVRILKGFHQIIRDLCACRASIPACDNQFFLVLAADI